MSHPDDEIKDQIESALGGRSEEELRKLAAEIVDNVVFTNRHIRLQDKEMLGMIFLPIMLGDSRVIATVRAAGLIYEYYDKALPRSCNGYPFFMSFDSVLAKDMPALELYVREYTEMKQKFLSLPPPPQVPVPGS
jgi:hypothetical protein